MPHCARKVPEVDWLAVGDEEGLTVDALGVERYSGAESVCLEKSGESEDVAVGNVLDVGKVKEVFVVADLKLCLPLAVSSDYLW